MQDDGRGYDPIGRAVVIQQRLRTQESSHQHFVLRTFVSQ